MNTELVDAIRDRRALLFVGAGVSMNAGLPSWTELVGEMAKELGYEADVFSALGTSEQLADFYLHKKGAIGAFRSRLDREWHGKVDISKSEVHRLIVDLNFPIIYTTNFDRLLETAYAHHGVKYSKITSPGDFVAPTARQIVKFHGDFDDDQSLVLSETHFFSRLDFESALDIRLRSDLIGRTVLFLGYSLSDINIRYMLYRLHRLWKGVVVGTQPHSFIWLTRPNAVQEAILTAKGIVPIVSEKDDAAEGILEFLRRLKAEVGTTP